MMKICAVLVAIVLSSSFISVPTNAQQSPNIVISPTRLILEGRQRSAEINLLNQGGTPGTYRIDMVELGMNERGEISKTDQHQSSSATSLIRYSPRQVTIAPGEVQTIRVMLRKPKNLAAGEYRSHLRVQVIPGPDAFNNIEEQRIGDTGIGVKLLPIFGQSMPIIVRHGETAAAVSLATAKLVEDDGPAIDFEMHLEGNRSVYGEIVAEYHSNAGNSIRIGTMNVAMYQPLTKRSVQMKLDVPEGADLSSGKIKLMYNELPESGGNLDITAETEMQL